MLAFRAEQTSNVFTLLIASLPQLRSSYINRQKYITLPSLMYRTKTFLQCPSEEGYFSFLSAFKTYKKQKRAS